MLDEYQKSDDSFFAPYLSYLFDETIGGITTGLLPPAGWRRDRNQDWGRQNSNNRASLRNTGRIFVRTVS